MEDQACPRCKTTKYRNPALKLMVNICGHTLCESCVDLLFLKGSGSCPECQTALRRVNFRVQLYEDASVEKEVDIRRRVLREYNKKEEDFATQKEYDQYLEEVEDIIYNLSNDIDVIEMNKKIEQYKKDNKEQILRNKSRIGKREQELEELLEIEKQEKEDRRLELAREELENKKRKLKDKEAIIDELMLSEVNAKDILNSFASAKQIAEEDAKVVVPKATGFSTGIKFGQQSNSLFLPIPKVDEGPAYEYIPIIQTFNGPEPPSWKNLHSKGYISQVRSETPGEKAGGFVADIACLRALQEAMAGLYHNPSTMIPKTNIPLPS